MSLKEVAMIWIMRSFTIKELLAFDILKLEQSLKHYGKAVRDCHRLDCNIPIDATKIPDFADIALKNLENYYMKLVQHKGLDVPEYKLHEFINRYVMYRSMLIDENII